MGRGCLWPRNLRERQLEGQTAVVVLLPAPTSKEHSDSLPGTKCSLPSYLDSKIHQQRDQDQKDAKEQLERGKAEKGEKWGRSERAEHLEIFRTISILYGAFC